MSQINKIIEIATEEIGYLEKKSNADLDHKTKNSGYNNYTKYWRDLSPSLQAQPWCAALIVWCARQADITASIIPTIFSCAQIRNWARDRGLYYIRASATPQRGDLVIYQDSNGTPNHIGLVVEVSTTQIFTIEGNTSSGNNNVDPNGGGVFRKSYQRSNTRIAGYFRPKYESGQSQPVTQPQTTAQKPTAVANYQVRVNTVSDPLNVRSEPSTARGTATIIRKVQKDSIQTIVAEIVGSDGKKWGVLIDGGYISLDLTVPHSAQPQSQPAQNKTALNYRVRIKTKTDPLNVRSEPSTAGGAKTVIRKVQKDSIQTVVSESDGPGASKWCELIDGGWISSDFVEKI